MQYSKSLRVSTHRGLGLRTLSTVSPPFIRPTQKSSLNKLLGAITHGYLIFRRFETVPSFLCIILSPSKGESNEDSDDSDSDFETSAKRKQKKSLPPPPKTSAKKDSGQHNRGTGSNKQGSTAGGGAGPLSNGDGKAASGVAVEKETMTYVWEIAKTSRAMCRRRVERDFHVVTRGKSTK